jgi:hypothetical protein
MNAILISAAFSTIILATPALAQQQASTERLGEHPAVIVKRNFEKQGYDYASKFYPHPAWLYVRSGPSEDDRADVAARSERAPVAPAETPIASAASAAGSRH